jgi:hypothetical protein
VKVSLKATLLPRGCCGAVPFFFSGSSTLPAREKHDEALGEMVRQIRGKLLVKTTCAGGAEQAFARILNT